MASFTSILITILVLIVIIAIIGGAGTGFFFWFTNPPKDKAKCKAPDADKFVYRNADGKEACCPKSPEEWSRLHRQYTKCPP